MLLLSSILLVDDDRTTHVFHKLLLTQMGVAQQVLTAENDERALPTLDQTCNAPDNSACPKLTI